MFTDAYSIVFDFSYLYYKYKYALETGRLPRFTTVVNGEERDISQVYYALREIELARRNFLVYTPKSVITVCFDMPSDRKLEGTEGAAKYKSNRAKKLSEEDFENIQFIEGILKSVGYNTYRINNFEADDIIYNFVNATYRWFGYTVIYTPDADVLVNIKDRVYCNRYKTGKGYTMVGMNNFSDYLSAELKAPIPYNALMLYKSTVGDKSDCIDGIKGFGVAAFRKLVCALSERGVSFYNAGTSEAKHTAELLNIAGANGMLSSEQLRQAFDSLDLVKPKNMLSASGEPIFDIGNFKLSNREMREAEYSKYKMTSLID